MFTCPKFHQLSLDLSKENKHDGSSRHVRGTLRDFLHSHLQEDNGMSLNGLDFPMPWLPPFPSTFATDVTAFNATLDMPLCSKKTQFPASSMRWGLAATSGAHHLWHIDCDGFCTCIEVKTGFKLWVLGSPRSNSMDGFSSISDFLDKYDIDSVNDETMALEAILLVPGSTL